MGCTVEFGGLAADAVVVVVVAVAMAGVAGSEGSYPSAYLEEAQAMQRLEIVALGVFVASGSYQGLEGRSSGVPPAEEAVATAQCNSGAAVEGLALEVGNRRNWWVEVEQKEAPAASHNFAGGEVAAGEGCCILAPYFAVAWVVVVQARVQLAEVSSQMTANASFCFDSVTVTATLSESGNDYSCGSGFGFWCFRGCSFAFVSVASCCLTSVVASYQDGTSFYSSNHVPKT